MQKLYIILVLLAMCFGASAQDDCSSATILCNGDARSGSTVGATFSATDPPLSCGDGIVDNSVWFKIIAINNGNCTVNVSRIDNTPGLDMEVFSGSCGSLVSTGFCTSGSGSSGGTMSVSFPTISGLTYYVMVDGSNGNQELFTIQANSADDAIIAKPGTQFDANPTAGCYPLIDSLLNHTTVHGGTQITYQWKFDLGAYIPSSGLDTAVLFNVLGNHDIELKVSNAECGFTRYIQSIEVYDLFPSINFLPNSSCVGTPIFFIGDATISPDSLVPANVSSWRWDFGDPNSGANDTATGQFVIHTFVGPGASFNVKLVVDGLCGPDSVFTVVNLLPKPTVSAGPPQFLCENQDALLIATTSNAAQPIAYQWSGPGFFSCSNCDTTTLTGLAPGGPYTVSIDITDSLGCAADTTVDITVNTKPVVDAGLPQTYCINSLAGLHATPVSGIPPYSYAWSPGTGLSDSLSANPTFTITGFVTYCVTMTDSGGCTSDPVCVDNDIYPPPSAAALTPVLCANDPALGDTIDVSGPGAGSVYSWVLSTSYATITGANADSSSIYLSFPTGPVTSYDFTVIVQDGVTGCIDTVSTSISTISTVTLNVSGTNVICQGDATTLTASGALAYAWTASPAYVFADSTLATQNVSPAVTTVFTITGNIGGCNGVINDTVFVNPKPVASADTIPGFCSCATVNLDGTGSAAGMNYLWSSAGGSVITNANSLNATAVVCFADAFTLRVTDPLTGCFTDTTITATPRSKPDAIATANPTLICPGVLTAITLDGTGSNSDPLTTYHWSSNNPVAVILDTTAITTSSDVSAATVFTLTVTDSFGCDSTTTASVDVYPAPTITASSHFLCVTDPLLQSDLTVNGASPGSSYNWTLIPGCVTPNSTSSSSQTFDFGTCGAGVYNFNVTVSDISTGCSTDLADSVSLINTVTLSVTPDTGFCEGGTAFLYASGANSYLWNPGGQVTDTISVPGLIAPGSPYSFTVIGTVGSCQSSSTINVTVNPLPVTGPVSGAITVCANATGLVYDVTPSTGNYTWSIVGGTITSGQNTSSITVDWNGGPAGTLSVFDTTSLGCHGVPSTLNVTINPPPGPPSILGSVNLCENSSSTFQVIPNPGSQYYWAVTGGTINGADSGNIILVDWSTAGSGFVSVSEQDALGCMGTPATSIVNINPKPLPAAISGSALVCDSAAEYYTVAYNPGSTYNWFGTVNGIITSISVNQDSALVTWNGPGNDNISVTEINSFGCASDTTPYPVVVSIKPQVFALPDTSLICAGSTLQLNGNANVPTVHWMTTGTGTFDDTTIYSPVYTPGVSDTGYFMLTMVASYPPCADAVANVVLHVSPIPVATVAAALDSVCIGNTDTLVATGGGSYLWSPNGEITDTIIVNPTVNTNYIVTVTNTFGCNSSDSAFVTVIPNGTPTASPDMLLCVGDSASLTGSFAFAGGMIWTTLGDGVFHPTNTDANPYYIPGTLDTTSGSATLLLTTTGSNCLNLTDTVFVTIRHLPTVYAGRDTIITSGSTSGAVVPLNPQVTNAGGVLWLTTGSGNFTPADTSLNATYTPSAQDYASGPVTLTLSSVGGCLVITDNLSIEFTPFTVPNVFTPYPLSPGFNDYFEIKNLPPDSKLEIWNRWGLLVYKTDNYRNDWDAAELNGDAYFYVLKLANGKEYHGQLRVIRE